MQRSNKIEPSRGVLLKTFLRLPIVSISFGLKDEFNFCYE